MKQLLFFISLLLLGPSLVLEAQTPVVGSLGGEVVVTPLGLAAYSIPIEVVPGTQGIQPALSVNYSSGGGRGLLGSCWDLGGLSSIARVPRTPYHDGDAGAVNFDSDDRYSLDGTRLLRLADGTYAVQGAVYGKETEDFTRVTLNGTPDSQNQYFTAVTDNGTVVEYGNGGNSRQQLGGKTLAWWVRSVTDPDGNYMTFEYSLSDGEILPNTIYYTGNQVTGQQTYAKVCFLYRDDPNANKTWVGGKPMTVSHLLSGISVCYGTDTVRRYTFEYDLERTSRLDAVVLRDSNGTELTRTAIAWGEDGTAAYRTIQGLSGTNPIPGDFDGDNITDLFLYSYDPTLNRTSWSVVKGSASGQFSSTALAGSFTGYQPPGSVFAFDVEGNGVDEIGHVMAGVPEDSCSLKVFHFNGSAYSHATMAVNKTAEFLPGDFLGTGGVQIVTVGEASGNLKAVKCLANNVGFTVGKDSRVSVTDLNGNGKADIQVVGDNHVDVFEFDALSGDFTTIASQYMAHSPNRDYFGDFNGDGNTDYVYFTPQGFFLKMSKGNDYTPRYSLPFIAQQDNSGNPSFPLVVGDANGDGKDDFVQPIYNYHTQKLTLVTYFSRGLTGDDYQYDTVHLQNDAVSNWTESMYRFAEMDCDGQLELFYSGSIFDNPVIVDFPERRGHDLAASFTDGYGKTTLLAYGYYNTPGTGFSGSPMKHVRWPLVTRTAEPNGTGGSAVTFHTYGDAHYDPDRRMMLGFGWYSAYHEGDNICRHSIHDPILHRMALEQVLAYYHTADTTGMGGYVPDPGFWNREDGILYHYETFNTPAALTLGHGRFLPYDAVSSSVNRLENTKAVTTTRLRTDGRVDGYSIAYSKAMPSEGAPPVWVERDSTVLTYQTVTLPNGLQAVRPATVRIWHRRNGFSQTPWAMTSYLYRQGRLQKVARSDTDGAIDTTRYAYNGFGLPDTVTLMPDGLPPAATVYSYDSKGRFATSVKNPAGHISSAQYNPKTGLVLQSTDANGLVTAYQYDPLGRVVGETRPDGTYTAISYEWDSGTFPNAAWRVRRTAPGLPETVEWRDLLGRIVHTYRDGRGYDDVVYDAHGRPFMNTFVPYNEPSSARRVWHTTGYDRFGRVVSETDPLTNLVYAYYDPGDPRQDDCYVTVTDNIMGAQRTRIYDALGRIKQALDGGGTIGYAYGYVTRNGRVLDQTTVTACGETLTVLSDLRGNRVGLDDPDAGDVTSEYDALGRLTCRTDANGNTVAYTYDILGRTLTVTFSDGNATETVGYTYDNAPGKGVGRIASVSHDGVVERSYRYDNLGRLSRLDITDGVTYTHLYDYDNLGRLQYLTYPSGFRTRHTYNSRGESLSVYDDASDALIFSTDTRDAFGHPLMCRYGNGTGVQYTYDIHGRLTAIRNGDVTFDPNADGISGGGEGDDADGPASGPSHGNTYTIGGEYRRLAYAYDSRGFISSRSDANTGQAETYSYDALGRLSAFKVNGVTADSLAYDGKGNITLNTAVGAYAYNGDGPHAVSRITGSLARPGAGTDCDAAYGLRNLPTALAEGSSSVTIDYDADGMRRHTRFFQGNTLERSVTRISGIHEVETRGSATRKIDYIHADGRVVAVHVRNGNADSLYYVISDHLGSWNMVTDGAKNTVQSTHFDPWGNRMSHTAWGSRQTQVSFPFSRGFTGHEHYDRFGIVNANARLYDPAIGRFFSPDPFVQMPDFTQSFNRYSYCMNNPVMYSDPDGKYFIVDSWIIGFVSKLFKTGSLKQSWDEANKRAGNDAKLWGGLFVSDENKSFWSRTWEIVSRFTWQAPQTIVGWIVSESCNTLGFAGGVESVEYKYGATVTRTNNANWGAVTLGSYITGSNNIRADENNYLFQHEYGHYLQSQATGIFYLTRYGIPSGLNCLGKKEHDDHPVEQDANIRAYKYFNKHIEGFNGWKKNSNPINGYDWSQPYTNESNQMALKQGLLRPAWYDYFLIFAPLVNAYINWLVLENY